MTADERLALIRLKIERADKHLACLNATVRSFLDSKPYKHGTKRDPETRKLIYYLESVQPIPVDVAAIAGDALHCLRDALDHLAQQLYLVGTGNAHGYRDKTSFPISPTAKDFKNVLARKVEGMRKDAIDAIRALEPYDGGQGTDLWTLHRLNNIDKHRLIITVASVHIGVDVIPMFAKMFSSARPDIADTMLKNMSVMIKPADKFPLKAGDELYIDAADAEPDENMKFAVQIALYELGICEGQPILETLVQFRNRINGIVEAFRPCLE